ncbi:hypothetical protein EU537_01355 [Candidatus Thorarchaeota archaeon]|nr:MAG: hypothetical protein EU537_01355 [Candidatus Thorarchaeota archaeon]
MSLLGKYRKEEEKRDKDTTEEEIETTAEAKQQESVAVPNKERNSPIMSFSVSTDLRSCLQAVRTERAINLSMWVERKLRDAVQEEFPNIAGVHLES